MRLQLMKGFTGLVLLAALIAGSVTLALALDPKGRPKGMGPNAPGGYYIWQDEKGWHLRATTGSQKHRFDGEIISEGGTISAVKQYREEPASWFKQQGNKITFDLTTDKNIDGIDFQADGNITFKLRFDDREEASTIHVGANGENPASLPFTLPSR